MVIEERPDGIRIVRITRPEEAIAYRASFAGAYQEIFSLPPYNERYFPSEAVGVLRYYLQAPEHITLLAVTGRTNVVGFGIAVPAKHKPDIARAVMGLLPVPHTYCLAELGVLEACRGSGLGRSLVRRRIRLIDTHRYTHVVLRVSAVRNVTYDMYMRMGFLDMGVAMEVSSRRTDGAVRTDRRIFLSKVLLPGEGTPLSKPAPGLAVLGDADAEGPR